MPPRTKAQGALYDQATAFAKDLETSQVAAVDQMLGAWTDSYWGIRGEMDAFLAKVEAAKAAGTPMSPAWAYQQDRLKTLLATTKTQIARYAADASLVTTKAQQAAIAASLKHAQSLTATAVSQSLPTLAASFSDVNPKALEHMVGFLADGSVLRNHLALTLPGEAADALQSALLHGLATGKSQAWMLQRATQALGVSHTRATTILRTESLRAYRAASRAQYLANQDLLGGWTWHANLDARTCVACALMDGTEHPLDAILDGHPRCRCAMVPRTKTWEQIGVTGLGDTRPPVRSGKAWLESQTPSVQRAMMGRAKFNAWTAGQIGLDDMVGRTYSPQWGTMRAERSLKAIQEDRNANWQDTTSLKPMTVAKPPPVPQMGKVGRLADRYDLAYLQEWADTPGNSPQVLANVQAAVNLKVARQGRIGPRLPKPDAGKVKAAVEKLRQAVFTKGYPSKGYSQTKAVYKAQANGTPGTKVGVVKSLSLDQKITAQAILDEHDAALPMLARQAEKKAALAKAQAEAVRLNKVADAQVEAQSIQAAMVQAKAAQKAADEAAEAYGKNLDSKIASTGGHVQAKTLLSQEYAFLQEVLDDVGPNTDPAYKAAVDAKVTVWMAKNEAYDQAVETVQTNGWGGTSWTHENGLLTMVVKDDGWGELSAPGSSAPINLPPTAVWKTITDPESGMTQTLTPDADQVEAWLDTMKGQDGNISQTFHAMAAKHLEKAKDGKGTLTPQQIADLQEALDQANVTAWAPDADAVKGLVASLDDELLTVDDLLAELEDGIMGPLDKANAQAAIAQYEATLIAKAASPIPKPVIDPAKIKWEKVSEAQVAKYVTKVQSGSMSLDDLYAAFQNAKNAGPKANYAKAIHTLEGKDVGDLPTPAAPTVPTSDGPTWPTKPPWNPDDLSFTGTTLGTHGAKVYDAPDGTRWLFKPPKDPKDGFLASLDEAASRFQSMVGLRAPDTYVVTLGGKRGSIQRMFPAKDGFPNGFQPASLSKADLGTVQREHVLDWMLANHDGHRDQFLRLEDGSMVGIDKGQAFRWFGQDRLDWDFHPNANYGAPEPVYNALWRDFANGKDVDLDPPGTGPMWDQIKAIQAVSDDDLREMFRAYAEQAAARGLLAKPQKSFTGVDLKIASNDVEAFLDALVARKNSLGDDFTALYDKAAKARAKALPGWTPKAATPKASGRKAKWVGAQKPEPPKPPAEPKPDADLFDAWLAKAKKTYSDFSGGKSLEASNNWARFRRVVEELDETAAKELLDRKYLSILDYQEAMDLITKAKRQTEDLRAAYTRALAEHAKAMAAYKRDLGDWKDANGVKDLTAGMDDGVLRHNTDQAGVTWAQKHFDQKRYTATQRKWLKSYTGSAYRDWNTHLRQTKGKPTKYQDAVQNIDKAMDAQPIPEDVILHRGTGQEAFQIDGRTLGPGDDLKTLIGSVQVDHGYMSTSVGNSAAFSGNPVQLKIRAPAGTPGSYVQMFSQFNHERELILARGTHLYVHNAYQANGKWIMEVEVVPDDFDPVNATPSPSATTWSN